MRMMRIASCIMTKTYINAMYHGIGMHETLYLCRYTRGQLTIKVPIAGKPRARPPLEATPHGMDCRSRGARCMFPEHSGLIHKEHTARPFDSQEKPLGRNGVAQPFIPTPCLVDDE